ncbi:MAG: hypothetical protein QNJ54_34600 [Prochloraceae cyanobacterium]|nr:hypothetical protein [Prochloraceae cyanobacterium]
MNRLILLDSGPLGKIANPRQTPEVKRCLQFIKEQKIALRVAEIIDYELRRNYLLEGFTKSISKLNKYRQTKQFIPLTSEIMLEAAELWAWLQAQGLPTSSKNDIDKDVILVASALSQKPDFDEVIILTSNAKHFVRFEEWGILTWDWKQALSDCRYNEINFYH